jgi:hypothetical protein
MEVKAEDEMAGLVDSCLLELDEIEAAFINGQYFDQPRVSLPEFAQRWSLSKKAMDELRSRVAGRMKELLTRKGITSITDIV